MGMLRIYKGESRGMQNKQMSIWDLSEWINHEVRGDESGERGRHSWKKPEAKGGGRDSSSVLCSR